MDYQFIKKSQFDLNDLSMDFDATIFYPGAMWDDQNVYPKIETGHPFTLDMNDELVKLWKNFLVVILFKILPY